MAREFHPPALAGDAQIEVDGLDEPGWNALLPHFADANLYQTWAYEAVRSGEQRMSHLVVKRGGQPVAAAQVRLLRIPVLGRGVAYVRWGPLWQPRGGARDPALFALAVQALREEYVVKRRLTLRLLPHLFDDEAACFVPLLTTQGYAAAPTVRAQRTLLLPLGPTDAQLRAGMNPKWRNGLNQALRNGLALTSGTGDELFEAFLPLYAQMHRRKGFAASSDVREFRAMQPRLPEGQKLHVWLALQDGKPVAGLVGSGLGDMGVYLFGATGDAGMASKASYLLQWEFVRWLKAQGARVYNLHGIDPLANPGTFHFKSGLSGRLGRDLHYVGGYDLAAGRADEWLWKLATTARARLRGLHRPPPPVIPAPTVSAAPRLVE